MRFHINTQESGLINLHSSSVSVCVVKAASRFKVQEERKTFKHFQISKLNPASQCVYLQVQVHQKTKTNDFIPQTLMEEAFMRRSF